MARLLRANFWIVRLLGLVVVAAFAANTANTAFALVLMRSAGSTVSAPSTLIQDDGANPDADASEHSGAPADSPDLDLRPRPATRSAERILSRNIFCPTCSPETPPGDESVPSAPDATNLSGARRSALPLTVAATMEHEDPSRSMATLVDNTRGVGGLYRVGDSLGPGVSIVHVTTGMVHIEHAGVLEYIPFEGAPVPAAPIDRSTPPPPAPSRGAIAGASEAIECTDRGDCIVERAFVETLFADPKLLVGQARVSPATTKGGAPGFRLRGIRGGTLPDLLGLKNGDVITEVGGTPLTMTSAMELFTKLRHASHLEVMVDRRGTSMRRQLEIRS